MPDDIVYKLKVKDESASGFSSYLRNLRATNKEASVSGERAFESAIKSGPEGLLKLAGVGLGGAIIQSVVGQLKAATSSIRDNITGLRTGTATRGDVLESTLSELPFGIGEGWDLGRNIRELFTGEDAKQQIEDTQNQLKSTIQASRTQTIRALLEDHRQIAEKIYQTGDYQSSGGTQSLAAKIHAAEYSSDSDIRASKEAINKQFSVQEDAAGKLVSDAQGRIRNELVRLGSYEDHNPLSPPGLLAARQDKRAAEAEIARIEEDKKSATNTAAQERKALLQNQIAALNLDAKYEGYGALGGIGGRLAALNNGGSVESRTLNYQIQNQLSGDELTRQLTALGPQGAAALPILQQYLKLANSPSQLALAGGALGPISLPGESSLPTSYTGLASNQRAAGEIQRMAGGEQKEIASLLRQILTAIGGGPRAWNNNGGN